MNTTRVNPGFARKNIGGIYPVITAGMISVSVVLFLTRIAMPVSVSAQETKTETKGSAGTINTRFREILQTRCCSCHGSQVSSGGLRLDHREGLVVGGYSQKSLLSPLISENEIYRRVASPDASYRMPKGQDALPASEIDVIRKWVETGARWSEVENPGHQSIAEKNRAVLITGINWETLTGGWVNEVPGFVPWLCSMLLIQLGLLFVERWRQAYSANRPWAKGIMARWLRPMIGFHVWHYLLIQASMVLLLSILVCLGQLRKRDELEVIIADLKRAAPVSGNPTTFSIYGNPPIPHHPGHPPTLSHTYYRGNCERNPQLFNRGNYRTATMRVALVDENGRELTIGDKLPARGAGIRFDLERAKGTTDALFGSAIEKGVFLTEQVLLDQLRELDKPVYQIRVIKPNWKWQVTIPLSRQNGQQETSIRGLIYVYQGTIEGNSARGTVHYGIKYDLHLTDRAIQSGSEVWLGSLFWNASIQLPNSGKIPFEQWFDDEPIPEISGSNSTDPELLGITEHLQKDSARRESNK